MKHGPDIGMAEASLRRVAKGIALLAAGALAWTASGTVKDAQGAPLGGVSVSSDAANPSTPATTNAAGEFTITGTAGIEGADLKGNGPLRLVGGDLEFRCACEGSLVFSLFDASGREAWRTSSVAQGGVVRAALPLDMEPGAHYLRVRYPGGIHNQAMGLAPGGRWKVASHLVAARSAATLPTLTFSKSGYANATYAVKSETESGIAVTLTAPTAVDFVEDHRSECTIPAMPAVSTLTSNSKLPNPFKMMDGTPVTTMAQWKCRREEMLAMVENYELGVKPRNPEKVTGSFSGNTLTVTVVDKGKTLSFTATITKPSGTGPFPALIGFGGGSLGTSTSGLGLATINYTATDIASDGTSHGGGKFYTMYGNSATAGSLIGWAWGISRIIDALAVTPAAGIDVKRLAVTGCSRYGKGALMAGVFDQRIALTIPQEGGGGGVSAWRVIAAEKAAGQNIEQYENLSGGTNWLGSVASSFGNSTTGKLPHDHNFLSAAVAPRALLSLENQIDWLGPNATYVTSAAAHEYFVALGAEQAHTYSLSANHGHCSLPTEQNHWVKSYIQKYLLGGTGEAAKVEATIPGTYVKKSWADVKANWMDYTIPTLK